MCKYDPRKKIHFIQGNVQILITIRLFKNLYLLTHNLHLEKLRSDSEFDRNVSFAPQTVLKVKQYV